MRPLTRIKAIIIVAVILVVGILVIVIVNLSSSRIVNLSLTNGCVAPCVEGDIVVSPLCPGGSVVNFPNGSNIEACKGAMVDDNLSDYALKFSSSSIFGQTVYFVAIVNTPQNLPPEYTPYAGLGTYHAQIPAGAYAVSFGPCPSYGSIGFSENNNPLGSGDKIIVSSSVTTNVTISCNTGIL